MKFRHLPVIDRRYWTAILFASILGANLGDLYAHDSGLGTALGLLVLLGLFVAIYMAEMRDRASREAYYWLAIVVVCTGATNIADYLAFRRHIPQLALSLVLAGLIAAFGGRSRPIRSLDEAGERAGREKVRLGYWSAMLCAGVFGTVVGDVASHDFGQGFAGLTLAVILAGALGLLRGRAASGALVYWAVVALARTAGTCLGDWFAETPWLRLGLPLSACLTGAAFVLILTVRRSTRPARAVAA